MTLSPTTFSTGIGSPVIIDSSIDERPVIDLAINRDLLARPNQQHIADLNVLDCNLLVAAIRA